MLLTILPAVHIHLCSYLYPVLHTGSTFGSKAGGQTSRLPPTLARRGGSGLSFSFLKCRRECLRPAGNQGVKKTKILFAKARFQSGIACSPFKMIFTRWWKHWAPWREMGRRMWFFIFFFPPFHSEMAVSSALCVFWQRALRECVPGNLICEIKTWYIVKLFAADRERSPPQVIDSAPPLPQNADWIKWKMALIIYFNLCVSHKVGNTFKTFFF